jgi:hypothetical protein
MDSGVKRRFYRREAMVRGCREGSGVKRRFIAVKQW